MERAGCATLFRPFMPWLSLKGMGGMEVGTLGLRDFLMAGR